MFPGSLAFLMMDTSTQFFHPVFTGKKLD